MLSTLNPKVCLVVAIVSLTIFVRDFSYDGSNLVSFLLGAAATAPLIAATWQTMKDNWPVYRKFYSMSFHRRDPSVIARSWQLTWWIIPYTLVVYPILELFVLANGLGTVYTFFYGAVFVVFGYTMAQGPWFYQDAKSAIKK